jgi:hypothetical protein
MIIEKIKILGTIVSAVFVICVFIQTLLTLNPRVTDLEKRMATTEGKISTIELKIDNILNKTAETSKDVKDIYHIILDEHTRQ